ncbi:HAD-IA family hydrolase [Streptomyces sp. NPDC047117]|uniref:HAD family hydrolase n=1 Tax=Streptomyces sp. NPDC047117 TaxID=3155379 RepID=UPI0033C624E8
MAYKGVLFDFSGTLLRIEPVTSWLRGALDETGITMTEEAFAHTARELDRAGALPGGSSPEGLPDGLAELWRIRDRTAEHHRELYTALARQVPLPAEELYDTLYVRHKSPAAWAPYPDAADVLRGLRERGVATGVVSNIGWDLRPVLRAHGLAPLIDAYVLSYEHGIQKPDPRLFELACRELGLAPQDVLMVGDDRHADGGARALGCGYFPVDHLPAAERPDGLRPVLGLVD